MPQGTLLYPAYICHETPARGDRPRIHAKRNIVITLHIIHHPRSPLHPYAMGHCQPPCFHSLWNIRGGYCASQLVFESPVTGLEKDRKKTGLDRKRLDQQSGSLNFENQRPERDRSEPAAL